jgi:hypothetical protein
LTRGLVVGRSELPHLRQFGVGRGCDRRRLACRRGAARDLGGCVVAMSLAELLGHGRPARGDLPAPSHNPESTSGNLRVGAAKGDPLLRPLLRVRGGMVRGPISRSRRRPAASGRSARSRRIIWPARRRPAGSISCCPSAASSRSCAKPVEQTWSDYRYRRRGHNESRDFSTFIEDSAALDGGLYHRHLDLALFRRAALLVPLYEELIQDPARELGRLTDFLGVPMIWSDPAVLLDERVNPGEVPRFRRGFALARRAGDMLARHGLKWLVRLAKLIGVRVWFGRSPAEPSMSAAERAHLADFYRSDVRRLGLLLQRELDLWQRSRVALAR